MEPSAVLEGPAWGQRCPEDPVGVADPVQELCPVPGAALCGARTGGRGAVGLGEQWHRCWSWGEAKLAPVLTPPGSGEGKWCDRA